MTVEGLTTPAPQEQPQVAAPPAGTAPVHPDPSKETATRAFVVAARRAQAAQRQREDLKSERAALAAEKAAIAAERAELQTRFSKPANAIEALQRHGYSYQDATMHTLNDGVPSAEDMARAAVEEVQNLRKEQTTAKEQEVLEAQKRAETEAAKVLEDFRGEINSFVTDKGDDYEFIKLYDGQAIVYATIEQHFDKTGKVLSIKESADLVEKYLEEEVAKAATTKRVQAKSQKPHDPKEPAPPGQATAQRRSISNSMTSSTPTLVSSPVVEEDRMKRALAALS